VFPTLSNLRRIAENFYNNLTINDLSMLSKGVYFYTIVDKNSVLKAGQVVKQ
jgi:hypothetical protein